MIHEFIRRKRQEHPFQPTVCDEAVDRKIPFIFLLKIIQAYKQNSLPLKTILQLKKLCEGGRMNWTKDIAVI
jgi:hypothetical protein